MNKKLYRSRTKRMLSGVCGGLEDYLSIDVTIIRLIWVLVSLMSGGFPGIIAYVIAVFIVPEEPTDYYNNDINNYKEEPEANNNENEQ